MKKRILSGALALILTLGCAVPAGAAALPAVCDETYYATLDYYGAVEEASVVKSYILGDETTITDYGRYDEVVNLTDSSQPVMDGGKLTFTPDQGSRKFYFQGKTREPFDQLPWTLAVSYKLNGAPVKAEELAGRTGLVEIAIDALPNSRANSYARTNLVLTVATAFNDDDIVSLEAPGAETQLIGNLRTVLFAVLPGEEQHFVIRVGSDSFESAGLIFLVVPATLAQLEQVARLREAKEETEDSLEAIDASFDVILNTLDGMSGSLGTAADGLDRLNSARGTVSGRKNDIYAAADGLEELNSARSTLSAGRGDLSQKTDAALDSLGGVSTSLAELDQYSGQFSSMVSQTTGVLDEMNTQTQKLRPQLAALRGSISDLQKDAKELKGLITDVEKYNKKGIRVADSLFTQLNEVEEDTDSLYLYLKQLRNVLRATKGISLLSTSDLLGLLSADQADQLREVLDLHSDYESYLKANSIPASQLSFKDFIILAAYKQFCEQTVADAVVANAPAAVAQACADFAAANGRAPTEEETAQLQAQVVSQLTAQAQAALPTRDQFVQAPAAQPYIQKAQAASDAYDEFAAQSRAVDTANKKIREVNTMVSSLTDSTANVVDELADICEKAGESGTISNLSALAELSRDLLITVDKHKGEGTATIDDLNKMGDTLDRILEVSDDLLAQVDALIKVVDTYEPTVQGAIQDVAAASGAAQTALNDTRTALVSARELLGAAGDDLDSGAEKTLTGLTSAVGAMRAADGDLDGGTRAALAGVSAALRQSTAGLDQTGVIREAKDTVHTLLDDQWDAHSGGVDTLLMIDAGAPAVSMTSRRNPAPRSVQYIMRTKEIKLEKEAGDASTAAGQAPQRNFWQRIGDMFVGIWNDIVRLFTGKK